MKNARIAVLLLAALLCLAALVSCDDREVISVVAAYVGPEVTTTDRVFTKDDFYVVASYADGTYENPIQPKDYEFELVGMEDGYYIFNFTFRGFTQEEIERREAKQWSAERKLEAADTAFINNGGPDFLCRQIDRFIKEQVQK